MVKQYKIDKVEAIKTKLDSAKGYYLADFQGMDVAMATELRNRCREAGVERLDAGPKGATVAFHNNAFANPAGLIAFIQKQVGVHKAAIAGSTDEDDDANFKDILAAVKFVVQILSTAAAKAQKQ